MDNNSMDRYNGRMLDNRYEILEVIGRGGMAVVYKARCHLLNRYVAVKILRDEMAADEEFRERFNKEAQAVAMLSHPNIISVYDVSRQPGLNYIVMELVEGVTLKQYMKSKGHLDCSESVHFAVQIARALSHAHSKGIVHRDIKPQNIMIDLDGTVKVSDFGIAYLENAQAGELGEAVGSVHYISPEQARGLSVDARTDIYSLGVVMYEMLTGCLPFTGDTAHAVALAHISASPTPMREIDPRIPEELERITMKAMNADIEKRYQTADELLADLDAYRQSVAKDAAIREKKQNERLTPAKELPRDVTPIGRSGELTKESYKRRRIRAKKVSLLSGVFLVCVFIIAVFVFLWNYWLSDIFSDAVRITVPNFVGSNCDDIINNREFKELYTFTVVYDIAPDKPKGEIIGQDPEGGKSLMKTDKGIEIQLTVSTGMQMITVENVVNREYREAVTALQKQGFIAELEFVKNDGVTKNYVISTNPGAGETLPAGSTIYVTVSDGPTTATTVMPNLVGLTQSAALERIEGASLTLGSVSMVENDLPEGTVVWQSINAYEVVDEHSKVFIQVSKGRPVESAAPEMTPEPSYVPVP